MPSITVNKINQLLKETVKTISAYEPKERLDGDTQQLVEDIKKIGRELEQKKLILRDAFSQIFNKFKELFHKISALDNRVENASWHTDSFKAVEAQFEIMMTLVSKPEIFSALMDNEGINPGIAQDILFSIITGNTDEAIQLLKKTGNTGPLHKDPDLLNRCHTTTEEDYPLHLAVKNNPPNLELIRCLLDNGANPEKPDKTGHIPLSYATKNMTVLTLMLNHPNYSSASTDIEYAILDAISDGNNVAAKELLTKAEKAALPNKENFLNRVRRSDTKDYALHLAVKNEEPNLELIRRLLTDGADPNTQNKAGETALGLSVHNKEIFSILLQHPTFLMSEDTFKQSIFTVIDTNDEERLKAFLLKAKEAKLLEAGSNLFNETVAAFTEDSPLHRAVKNTPPNLELIQCLLDNGADPEQRNKNGRTPLCYVTKDRAVLELMLNHSNYSSASTNIEYAILAAIADNHTAAAIALLEKAEQAELPNKGNFLNRVWRTETGNCALHYAVKNTPPNLELIQCLLDNGTNPEQRNKNGRTPLCYATEDRAVLDLMLNHPNYSSASPRIEYAIFAAITDNNTVAAMALLEKAEQAELPNKENFLNRVCRIKTGNCALHCAVQNKVPNLELVQRLLTDGANPNEQNKAGETALGLSVHNKELFSILLQHPTFLMSEDTFKQSIFTVIDTNDEELLRNFLAKAKEANLLEAGSNLLNETVAPSTEDSPLHRAVKNEHPNLGLIQCLLDNSAILEKGDKEAKLLEAESNLLNETVAPSTEDSPLHRAIKNELPNLGLIQCLLDNGAILEKGDKNGWPPLSYATKNTAVLDLILNHPNYSSTSLHIEYAILYAIFDNYNFAAKKLLEKADSDGLPKHENFLNNIRFLNTGNYILHYAVKNKEPDLDLIHRLLADGADPNQQNNQAKTALDLSMHSKDVVSLILQHPTFLMSRTSFKWNIFEVIDTNDEELLKVFLAKTKEAKLLEQGNNLLNQIVASVTDDSPLHYAVKKGNGFIVSVLMNHGASPNRLNSERKKPCEYTKNQAILNILNKSRHTERDLTLAEQPRFFTHPLPDTLPFTASSSVREEEHPLMQKYDSMFTL